MTQPQPQPQPQRPINSKRYMQEHNERAFLEDVQFLLDAGESRERIAKRMGCTWSWIEKIQIRHRKENETTIAKETDSA